MNSMRDLRRARLGEAIATTCGGVPARAAKMLGVEPSYINDLLNSPTKSFGEKAARKIEAGLKLDPGFLDRKDNAPANRHGHAELRVADLVARKVKRLDEAAQLTILGLIETMINIADPGYWQHVGKMRQRAEDRDRPGHAVRSTKTASARE